MNRVLSFLLAYAFLQAQTWAIGGGPSGSNVGQNLIGTYAGVMLPTSSTNPIAGVNSSASIGLFGLAIPAVGASNGACVAFVDGIAFSGTLQGVADPKDATIRGIVQAVSSATVDTLVPVVDATTGQVTYQLIQTNVYAQGNVKAQVTGNGALDGSTRIEGTASLDLFAYLNPNGTPATTNTVKFRVDGFKQSSEVAAISFTVTTPTGTGTAGGGGTATP
jgi:hypothetical protein